ncbi:MAG: hypothetical protein HY730_02975 [Candidatus Tectomicrobia bacterium]|uniref:Rhamnogalacturonan lyase domain-containing protein n=1 Tax=Tectimicrobiota bacterium TaxID=2528274 RepID=A0A933LQH4_UNCTE|nr:hypothetical protein [Candidatus Tectomicrobia bacterium]
MKKTIIQVWLLVFMVFFSGHQVFGYQEIEVSNGGAISGEVKLTGMVPKAAPLSVTKNQDYCGDHKPSEKLLVGVNGGIKNAVITIENIAQGKMIDKNEISVLENRNCVFVPHVQVVNVANKLEIRNTDPILHNTHAFLGQATVFNLAQPLQNQTIPKILRKPGLVKIQCDAGHTWMSAYILVTEHPYHAVTDENGIFKITHIPPGNYKLKVWHEELGEQVKEVLVKGGEEVKAVFDNLVK